MGEITQAIATGRPKQIDTVRFEDVEDVGYYEAPPEESLAAVAGEAAADATESEEAAVASESDDEWLGSASGATSIAGDTNYSDTEETYVDKHKPPRYMLDLTEEELATVKTVSYTHLTLPTKRIV